MSPLQGKVTRLARALETYRLPPTSKVNVTTFTEPIPGEDKHRVVLPVEGDAVFYLAAGLWCSAYSVPREVAAIALAALEIPFRIKQR